MKFTVDRIVEGIAVLEREDMSHIEVAVEKLPTGVKEGNVLVFDGVAYHIDIDAETVARERIINKQRSIFKKK